MTVSLDQTRARLNSLNVFSNRQIDVIPSLTPLLFLAIDFLMPLLFMKKSCVHHLIFPDANGRVDTWIKTLR